MSDPLAWVRAGHYVSLILVVGVCANYRFVLRPALGSDECSWPSGATRLRARLLRLAWLGFIVAVGSEILWLVLEAATISGRPFAEAIDPGILGATLSRTLFGKVWLLRLLASALLAGFLLLAGGGRAKKHREAAWIAALAAAAVDLAALAGTGHALDNAEGGSDAWHIVGDAIHLLAAGAWLGGLVPLALSLVEARRGRDPSWRGAICAATQRFSMLGMLSVGALLVTGIVNAWVLVGSIPGLIGTAYGGLLLAKVGLFAAMVGLAAINRLRLTPALLRENASRYGDPAAALRSLERNALAEASLGLGILVIVGVLGLLLPPVHDQAWWPLPFRLDWRILGRAFARPIRVDVLLIAIVAAAAAAGAARAILRRHRAAASVLAMVLIACGAAAFRAMAVPAFPTSFYHSEAALTAASVVHGARLFAERCAQCHGAIGKAAREELTPGEIVARPEGDLFWWIDRGNPAAGMPSFAGALDGRQEWDIVNTMRTRAAAARADLIGITAETRLSAPDFPFRYASGREETLSDQLADGAVLLAFFTLPASAARLDELARAREELAFAGLFVVALPLRPQHDAARIAAAPSDWGLAAASGPDVEETYRDLAPGSLASEPRHLEFLIDRAGNIRGRWAAVDAASAPPIRFLKAQAAAFRQEPGGGRMHRHSG